MAYKPMYTNTSGEEVRQVARMNPNSQLKETVWLTKNGSVSAPQYSQGELKNVTRRNPLTGQNETVMMDRNSTVFDKPMTAAPAQTRPLKDMIAPPTQPTTQQPLSKLVRPTTQPYQKAVDNSTMINDQYGNIVSALKASIQQSINNKNQTISGLGDKYQPDRNASEVAKNSEVTSLNEMAANAGDRGGIGRQNVLAAMVGGENRLNNINMQQKSEESALKNDIANLVLEGNVQEAQIQSQRLKDLISNNTYMDETNYNRQFNQEGRDLSNYQFDVGQQNADRNFGLQERSTLADMSGIDPITGKATMAKQGQDFSQNMQTKQFDTGVQQWNKEYKLKVDDINTRNQQWDKQFNSAEEQRKIENDLNLNKFNFDKETTAWNQAFETRKVNFAEAQTAIDNAFRQKQAEIEEKARQGQLSLQERELAHKINIDNRQLNLESAKFAYQKSTGGSGSGTKFDTNRNFNADDLSKAIDQKWWQDVTTPNGTGELVKTGQRTQTMPQRMGMIRDIVGYANGGGDRQITNQLFAKYNVNKEDIATAFKRLENPKEYPDG